jgi:hypothetical protein
LFFICQKTSLPEKHINILNKNWVAWCMSCTNIINSTVENESTVKQNTFFLYPCHWLLTTILTLLIWLPAPIYIHQKNKFLYTKRLGQCKTSWLSLTNSFYNQSNHRGDEQWAIIHGHGLQTLNAISISQIISFMICSIWLIWLIYCV